MPRDVRDTARQASFTRRAALLSLGTTGLFGTLFLRLHGLQVGQAEEFSVLAEENRVNVHLVVPLRGTILDRFGIELANNRQNFRVLLIPEDARRQGLTSVEDALDLIGRIVDLPDFRRRRIIRQAASSPSFVPITIKENLDWDEFARVNVNLPDLPGVVPDVGQTRQYGTGEHVSHLVGYVGAVTQVEQDADDDPLLRLPSFRIGKQGVERILDRRLRGAAGTSRVEVNAGGRVIRELARDDGTPGENVVLTIDEDIQRHTAEQFAGESGAAVVMDVNSGDILAMVSEPGFDPNLFTFGISHADWAALRDNPLNPMLNKAITGQYPPGSTFKMIVAMAALESGLINPRQTVHCNGHWRIGNVEKRCWRRQGHGAMNMRNAIKNSCDIYFYEIATQIGIERIAAMADRFGLGQDFDMPLTGERSGIVPNARWKRGQHDEAWYPGDTANVGIGQGYLLTTQLQQAVMTARLATGREVRPKLVRAIGSEDRTNVVRAPAIDLPQEYFDLVRDGMDAVINEAGGTATRSAVRGEGLSMAGKTGTVQVYSFSAAEREDGPREFDELPWRLRDHGLFVGYGPVDAPKYAVSVAVDHGGGGSRAAAPRARAIMQYVLEKDPSSQSALGPVAAAASSAGEQG